MAILQFKEALSAAAIVLTLVAFVPYIRSILLGSTRPPTCFPGLSGVQPPLWSSLPSLRAKGGVGAWPIGVSGSITLFIALLAYLKRADISISKIDVLFLVTALSSLPVWYFTADPLWAVVILTTVDLLGFGPTVRKLYREPFSESLLFFSLFAFRNILVILALQTYSVTTVLFPAVRGLDRHGCYPAA